MCLVLHAELTSLKAAMLLFCIIVRTLLKREVSCFPSVRHCQANGVSMNQSAEAEDCEIIVVIYFTKPIHTDVVQNVMITSAIRCRHSTVEITSSTASTADAVHHQCFAYTVCSLLGLSPGLALAAS